MRKAPYPTSQTHPEVVTQGCRTGLQSTSWEILDALTSCRTEFDLTSASITVLRALLSFLPKTDEQRSDPFLVWPSNEALAQRADGMDERTLRRHLARLSDAQLIERRSSPNGKRFALRMRKSIVVAYGFNLSPLFARKSQILEIAEAKRIEAAQAEIQRARILDYLHKLAAQREASGDSPVSIDRDREIRKLLRRSIRAQNLADLAKSLGQLLGDNELEAAVLSASNSQNDRHHQKTDKESLESVAQDHEAATFVDNHNQDQGLTYGNGDLTLEDCLEAASESVAFSPEPVRSWRDLIRLGETLAPMIGIGSELMDHVRRAMGPLGASISVLCLVQRTGKIARPAAYLRTLAQRADSGQFSLIALVRSARRSRFAAVN